MDISGTSFLKHNEKALKATLPRSATRRRATNATSGQCWIGGISQCNQSKENNGMPRLGKNKLPTPMDNKVFT